jgi:MATE family multidrug resistance protein
MALPITHRSVLAIAIPIMLSNVTEPMIGLVNTIVVGRLHEPYYIGAVAVGALIFSFVFWGFGFLRLSTGGYSAQATGAGDATELAAVLFRALMIALAAGFGLLLLSPVIGKFAFDLIGGSAEVRMHGETYFHTRIWSAPFALCNFAMMGWFIGQGQTRKVLAIQLLLNLTNMGLSALFVLHFNLAVFGVGLAAVLAEAAATLLGALLVASQLRRFGLRLEAARIFDRAKILGTVKSNTDIMIRTLCLVSAFAWFISRGARSGDVVVAANAVLLNLFELSAYLIDGFAYASEALVGQAVGARDRQRFMRGLKLTTGWAMVVGLACSLAVYFAGPWVIRLSSTNAEVIAMADAYLPLAALTPFLGALCFQFDGIFTGAMATREMRNMMLLSLAIYLAGWWFLEPAYGNSGLWLALCLFFVARGVTFALAMPGIVHRSVPA